MLSRLKTAAVVLLIGLLPVSVHARCMTNRPNIIVIVADDLGWTELPYFSPAISDPEDTALHRLQRPDLNRFAARSLAKSVGGEIRARALDDITAVFASDQLEAAQPNGAQYVFGTAGSVCSDGEIQTPNSCVYKEDLLGGMHTPPALGGLRRLAEGAVFSRFYGASSVCSPSRASILTGRNVGGSAVATTEFVHNTSAKDYPLAPYEVTIAEFLKQSCPQAECLEQCDNPPCCSDAPCYHTALFGKWHLGDAEQGSRPWEQGFDEFVGFLGNARDQFGDSKLDCYPPGPGACTPQPDTEGGKYSNPKVADDLEKTKFCNDDGPTAVVDPNANCTYQDRMFRDLAVKFINDNEPDDEPYFAMVAFHGTHKTWSAPARTNEHYKTDPNSARPNTQYWAAVEEIDAAVGVILDAAADEPTLVFFTSDNGRPGKGGYGNPVLNGGKSSMFEGGIRLGLLARACGSENEDPKLDLDAFVGGHADILPTIAEAVEYPIPPDGYCFNDQNAPCDADENPGCQPNQGQCCCRPIGGKSFYDLINAPSNAQLPPTQDAAYAVSRYLKGTAIVSRRGFPVLPGKGGVCAKVANGDPVAGSCVPCTPGGTACNSVQCTYAEKRCIDGSVIGPACKSSTDCTTGSCKREHTATCDSCIPAAWKLKRTSVQNPQRLYETVTNPGEETVLDCERQLPNQELGDIMSELAGCLDARLGLPASGSCSTP